MKAIPRDLEGALGGARPARLRVSVSGDDRVTVPMRVVRSLGRPGCGNLLVLNVDRTNIRDADVAMLGATLLRLDELSISQCQKLTTRGLASALGIQTLRTLHANLLSLTGESDVDACDVLPGQSRVTELSMSGTAVGPEFVVLLKDHCHALETLCIDGGDGDLHGVAAAISGLPALRRLSMVGLHNSRVADYVTAARAPVLEELRISRYGSLDMNSAIRPILRNMSPSIRLMEFTTFDIDNDERDIADALHANKGNIVDRESLCIRVECIADRRCVMHRSENGYAPEECTDTTAFAWTTSRTRALGDLFVDSLHTQETIATHNAQRRNRSAKIATDQKERQREQRKQMAKKKRRVAQ
jgi:hypothetical protein